MYREQYFFTSQPLSSSFSTPLHPSSGLDSSVTLCIEFSPATIFSIIRIGAALAVTMQRAAPQPQPKPLLKGYSTAASSTDAKDHISGFTMRSLADTVAEAV